MSSPIVPAPMNNPPLFYYISVNASERNILNMITSAASLLSEEPRQPNQAILGKITLTVLSGETLSGGIISRTMKKKVYRHLVTSSLISTAKFRSFVGLGMGFAIAAHYQANTGSTKVILITAACYNVIAIALRVLANKRKNENLRDLGTAITAAACLGVALTNYTINEMARIAMLTVVPAAVIIAMISLADGAHGETITHIPLEDRNIPISPNVVNTPSESKEAKQDEALDHAIDMV